jgi:hypothetical protein
VGSGVIPDTKYFPTNTPGAGGIGADRANKGGQFNDGIKIDTSNVQIDEAPPSLGLAGGGGSFGDASTNQSPGTPKAETPSMSSGLFGGGGSFDTSTTLNIPAPAQKSATSNHAEALAMIERLADWTKYDDDVDPVVEAYGKPKPASTRIPKQPRDWAKRTPAGTWQGPAIPRKRK